MTEDEKKRPRFKIGESARSILTKLDETKEDEKEELSTEDLDKYMRQYSDYVEKEGIGFGDKNEAYASRHLFFTESGMAYYEFTPYLYESEEEAEEQEQEGRMKLVNYIRRTNDDIYGVGHPTVERVYKH